MPKNALISECDLANLKIGKLSFTIVSLNFLALFLTKFNSKTSQFEIKVCF